MVGVSVGVLVGVLVGVVVSVGVAVRVGVDVTVDVGVKVGVGSSTVKVSFAVFPVPPFVELTASLVLFLVPLVVAVTSTVTVQVPLAAMVPPLKVNEVFPAVGAKVGAPQPVVLAAGIAATSNPAGNESVKATPVRIVLVFELEIVKVNVLTPPTAMGSGEKDFEMEGANTALTKSVSEPVLFPSLLSTILESGSTIAEELIRFPTAVGVTGMVTAKLPVVAPTVTSAPLAVQVNKLLPLIEQLMVPVIPDVEPRVADPYVAPLIGNWSLKIVCPFVKVAGCGPLLETVNVQLKSVPFVV